MLNTFKLSFSNIIMYLLPFVVTPILSRIYSISDFGEWGVFSSFISIVTIGMSWGLENVIIKTGYSTDEFNSCLLSIIASLISISLLAITFGIGMLAQFSFFVSFPEKGLLFVYLISYAIYAVLYNLGNKHQLYTALASNHILQGGMQAVSRVTLGLFSLSLFNGLILGTTVAQIVCIPFLLIIILPKCKHAWEKKKSSIQELKRLLIKYKDFPLYDAPSGIFAFAAFNMPVLILSHFFDKTQIGCYSIVLQLLLLPMSFVGSSIGKVYYQQICQAKHEQEISKKTEHILLLMSIIAILPLLFIACGGDKILILYLGQQWHNIGNIALCLSLWAFATVLTQPLLPLYRQKNKQQTLLVFDIIYFSAGVGCIVIGCMLTNQLALILLSYSFVCLLVKFALFLHILRLGQIKYSRFYKFVPIWLTSIVILILRLCTS